jgi:sec-independent protein translocase protein TatA
MGGRFGELLLLFIVAMLLFGPQKLPDLARAMGEAIREFKKAANGETTSQSQSPAPATQPLPPAQIQAQAPAPPPVQPAPNKPADPPSSVVS